MAGDVEGRRLSDAADVNGDGIADVLISAIDSMSAALRQSDGPHPLSTGLGFEAPLPGAVLLRSLPAYRACLPSSHPPLRR